MDDDNQSDLSYMQNKANVNNGRKTSDESLNNW